MGTSSKRGSGTGAEDAPERPAHRFGSSPPLTIGVEEELLLVDEQCGLVAAAEGVLERIDPGCRDAVSTEIFATQIELKAGVCLDAAQATEELRSVRRAVSATDARLMGSGLYPGDAGEAALVEKSRYVPVKRDLVSILDTPPCGLHVHVGVPDP